MSKHANEKVYYVSHLIVCTTDYV